MRAGESLLLDLDPAVVLGAVRALAAEGERFAPNPGQVRRKAVELGSPPVPTADQALAELNTLMSRVGHMGRPEFSHPAIADTVLAMGGWYQLCVSEAGVADRAHFLKLYGTVEARHTQAALLPPSVAALLSGIDLSAQRALPTGADA